VSSAVRLLVEAFAADDPGRSVVVESVRGASVAGQIRPGEPRPGASLLKLPLVGAVCDEAAAGALDMNAKVKGDHLRETIYPTVVAGFDAGHEFSVAELCALSLMTSDNPAAQYLLELVGKEAVNQTARRWGCVATRLEVGFSDASLGIEGRRNVTSATDALMMLKRLTGDPVYSRLLPALANSVRNFRIPLRLPPGSRVLHKTGSLDGVCNDVGLLRGTRTDLAVAFVCDRQADTARCSIEIGECVASVWEAVGEGIQTPTPTSAG
jgi:beta-lactamase class A